MENNPTENLRKRYLSEDGENPSKVTKLDVTNDIETPKNQLKKSMTFQNSNKICQLC